MSFSSQYFYFVVMYSIHVHIQMPMYINSIVNYMYAHNSVFSQHYDSIINGWQEIDPRYASKFSAMIRIIMCN